MVTGMVTILRWKQVAPRSNFKLIYMLHKLV